jgi:hypothetical protein
MEELIGRTIKGFAFGNRVYDDLAYNSKMNNYIGKIGTILDIRGIKSNRYVVKFEDGKTWLYPVELIESHLCHPFPTINTSTPMLCSDNEEQWIQDEILCQLPDNTYLSKDLYTWTFVKPLNKTV